jgi:hypothetical protein
VIVVAQCCEVKFKIAAIIRRARESALTFRDGEQITMSYVNRTPPKQRASMSSMRGIGEAGMIVFLRERVRLR